MVYFETHIIQELFALFIKIVQIAFILFLRLKSIHKTIVFKAVKHIICFYCIAILNRLLAVNPFWLQASKV